MGNIAKTFWVKNFEKFTILSFWTQLLEFTPNVPKTFDHKCTFTPTKRWSHKKGSYSEIQSSFWVKTYEKLWFELLAQLLLQFTSHVH